MGINTIREKSETYGENNISDIELLSMLLGENMIELFNQNNINNIDDLINLSEFDLIKINSSKSINHKIKAFVELYKRKLKYKDNKLKILTADDIYDNNRDMTLLNQEVLRLICMNCKNEMIYKEDIFKGSLNSAIVHPREIFKQALNKNSAYIIIIHNHPSGDPNPSNEDILITERIKKAGKIIGINLLDHLIIGKNTYCSFKDRGLV